MTQSIPSVDAEGLAALGICESLMLALTDRNIISDKEARDVLNDVATAHTNAAAASTTPEKHLAVVNNAYWPGRMAFPVQFDLS